MKKSSTHLSSLGMRLVCVYIFVCVCVLLLVLTTTNLGCETTFKICSNSFSKKKKKKRCVQKIHLPSILLCNYTQNNKY